MKIGACTGAAAMAVVPLGIFDLLRVAQQADHVPAERDLAEEGQLGIRVDGRDQLPQPFPRRRRGIGAGGCR